MLLLRLVLSIRMGLLQGLLLGLLRPLLLLLLLHLAHDISWRDRLRLDLLLGLFAGTRLGKQEARVRWQPVDKVQSPSQGRAGRVIRGGYVWLAQTHDRQKKMSFQVNVGVDITLYILYCSWFTSSRRGFGGS